METLQKILHDENPFDVNFLMDGLDILSKETDNESVSLCQEINRKVSNFPLVHRIGLDDFSINNLLAEGSFAKIYKVVKRDTKKPYVMKAMKKNTYVDYAVTERAILLTGDRENVIRAQYVFQNPLYLFFIMERMNGNFADFINRIPAKLFPYYTIRIAECLKSLHDGGYCHGDLKPGNILMTSTFDVKLADFGSSIPCLDGQIFEVQFGGTPWYSAPECFNVSEDRGVLCHATDWFSFGIIMFQIYSAKHQLFFSEIDPQSVKIQVKNEAYISERTEDIKNAAIRNIVQKILEFDYVLRPSFFDLAHPDNFDEFKKETRNHVEILMKHKLNLQKPKVLDTNLDESAVQDFGSIENNELNSVSQKLDYCGWYFSQDESSHLKELQLKHYELLKKFNLEQSVSDETLSPVDETPASLNFHLVSSGSDEISTSSAASNSKLPVAMEISEDENSRETETVTLKTVSFKSLSYTCVLCPKTYSTKGNLKSHVLVAHAGIRPRCEPCGQFFASGWCYRRHMATVEH